MTQNIKKFPHYKAIAQNLLDKFAEIAADKGEVAIAVSGGSTPLKIFEYWRDADFEHWDKLKIFWVDERVVPVDSDENNYGNAKRIFEQNSNFPLSQLFPMPTEGEELAEIYVETLKKETDQIDVVLLGIGDDGHTASIFPGQFDLFDSEKLVTYSVNPYSQQKRITLTGEVLFAAPEAIFIATGVGKKEILKQVIGEEFIGEYPAAFVFHNHINATIYTDVDL